jgi:hypothetical protein
VTFTQNEEDPNIHLVVGQFWGRAAEASWTEKSRALFSFVPHMKIASSAFPGRQRNILQSPAVKSALETCSLSPLAV